MKEWLNSTREMVMEFPNGEYFYLHYNEAQDRLEYGSCTNTGFCAEDGIDCDYAYDLNEHLQCLYEYMVKKKPELLYTNNEGWFDNLSNEQKVNLWNKYVELGKSGCPEDKVYPLDEFTINDNFSTAWGFATKVNGEKWDDCHYWWWFNRCTGWVESIEHLDDVINFDSLEDWATSPETFQLLNEMQNNGHEFDL